MYVFRASSGDANLSMGNMTYAASSPAATTGGQGNNPVSLSLHLVLSGAISGISGDRGLGATHHSSLSCQPIKSLPILSTIAHLPSHLLSALSFIAFYLLSVFLSRTLWRLLFLTRGDLNYSPCARIVAHRPRPFGAETNLVPFYATRVVCS